MKTLAVLPTYNEVDSIDIIITKLMEHDFLSVLVVDDGSKDGTVEMVRAWLNKTDRLFLIERPGKSGLGSAYRAGFSWGLEKGFDLFFEIDADLSHDPSVVPDFMLKIAQGYDQVVGSRYLNNTISVVGWDFRRLLLSKFGNWYASTLLGLKQFTDLTSGYRCYTRKALQTVGLENIRSNGYAFQIEMVFRVCRKGLNIAEIPIIFYERESGSSKMSEKIVCEAVLLPFKLLFEKILH